MRISEVNTATIKEYINAEHEADATIEMIIVAAKKYIKSFTGLTEENLDKHEDLTIAFLVICSDFYDQRHYILTENYNGLNANIIAENILNMYRVNLI